jgi:hypothetical protein
MKKIVCILCLFPLMANGCSSVNDDKSEADNNQSIVAFEQDSSGNYILYRNGEPYYIKGIGGNKNYDRAAAAGANSIRTWGTERAGEELQQAQMHNMTVYLNLWLSHNAADYTNEAYLNNKRAEMRNLLNLYKNHPALLMWSLGNENYLATGRSIEVLKFTNELAALIHEEDPNHPVGTILVGTGVNDINAVVEHAPAIDIIAINSYAAVKKIDQWMEDSDYNGPYIVTEWGVNGHWEVGKTSWGWPLEPISADKADMYLDRYNYIASHQKRCLGSYVFFWGQKQERTPTWFSMFIEDNVAGIELNGESCPTVDVMQYCWTGSWPANRAPAVTALTLNGKRASSSVTLAVNQSAAAQVTAADADGDALTYIWEIQEEPTDLGSFGSAESRPARVGNPITTSEGSVAIPGMSAGRYILFVYVLDGHNHAGTANIPFSVN